MAQSKKLPISIDQCIAAVKESALPLTAAEIAKAGKIPASRSAEVAEMLGKHAHISGIFEWPKSGVSRVFCRRTLRDAVEHALLQALEAQPLTPAQAGTAVRKSLRRVSAARALTEIKGAAPGLIAAKQVHTIAVNRQVFVYVGTRWLEKLLPQRAADSSGGEGILAALKRLQPGPGNYVRIDHLRGAPEVRRRLDDEAIELAEAGKLILGRYDGPRPVPEEEKGNYIEDKNGDLFIAIALPRPEAVGA